MLGWALFINNLGRRRYPVYWWKPGKVFVSATKQEQREERAREFREVEAGLRVEEGSVFEGNGDENAAGNEPPAVPQQT